jgi:hypothetical protein
MGRNVHTGKCTNILPYNPVPHLNSCCVQAALLGCIVDTITLSSAQAEMARKRAVDAGVEGQVHVHVCDYRRLPPEFEHCFDALVGSEFIEVKSSLSFHMCVYLMYDSTSVRNT